MNAKLLALIVVFVTNFKICQSRKYEQYSLFNILPIEVDHLKFLQNLEKQRYIDVTFWTKPVKLFQPVHFIVNPADKEMLLERTEHFKLKAEILLPDIQQAFDNQTIRQYRRFRVETYSWDDYHSLEDIYQWMNDLAQKFPGSVELISIGKSVEGREIYALTIKRGITRNRVIVEGGIHGNEWISTEFLTYLAFQLLSCNETDKRLLNLARSYDWHLIPVANPDGYAYSQKLDRLFFKNRNTRFGSSGVDLNRNFDYSFGKYAASSEKTDENYCGSFPFSEPETKALKWFINQKSSYLKFYFAIHGYGQKIVIPYSDRINHVEDFSEMENYGKQAILKMYKLYRTKYSVGTFYDTMGLRLSGNSASWVKKTHRVKHVFTLLLRDNGTFGHALPASEIIPACEEALVGLKELMVAKPKRVRSDLFNLSSTLNIERVFIVFQILIMFFY